MNQVRMMQTNTRANLVGDASSSMGIMSKIVREQGITQLWRGNNANMYKNLVQLILQVSVYDRVKNSYFPLDTSRYSGFDYYWRFFGSFSTTIGISAAFCYPLDLIHTRLVCDMSPKNNRHFKTTFDCFSRTNIDEGFRGGLYKGLEVSTTAATLRACLTMPLIDLVRTQDSSLRNASQFNSMVQSVYEKVGIALIVSGILSLTLYPMDTVKR